jgi:hypothetical protein
MIDGAEQGFNVGVVGSRSSSKNDRHNDYPIRSGMRCSNLSLNIVVCEAGISPDPRKYHKQASWIPDPGKADTFLLPSRLRVGA